MFLLREMDCSGAPVSYHTPHCTEGRGMSYAPGTHNIREDMQERATILVQSLRLGFDYQLHFGREKSLWPRIPNLY